LKRLVSAILTLLLLAALPVTALAAGSITVDLSKTEAAVGDGITVSGTATADTWITLEGTDAYGNILYFSGVKTDSTGVYSRTFKLPDMKDGTLTVSAGNGSMKASAAITVYTKKSTGGGSSGGSIATATSTVSVTMAASTVSAYDSEGVKTATVTITSSTDSAACVTTAVITAKNVASLIDDAKSADEGIAGIAAIKINVISTETAKTVSVSIPEASFKELAGDMDADIEIDTSLGTIRFNAKAADSIGNAGSTGTLCISIAQAEGDILSDEANVLIGSRPVYELSITSRGTVISDFGGGKATVGIPYTLTARENANSIVIYYITSDGELVAIPNCVYDTDTGTLTFTTKHFSTYAVGYHAVSFSDVSDSAWYADYVSFLAARGIIGGTGGGQFSPEFSITRAEFVTILSRMSDDDLNSYTTSAFSDVAASDWYFAAVQWAYENGVASGYDGKFNPNATITRQDIAVMLARYAEKVASHTLPKTNSAVTFTDSAKISAYASGAVTAMQQAGIVSGNSDGSFAPTANATRAQAAKMIAVLMKSMIGS